MAATIATATGYDKSGRVKTTTRLGSKASNGAAATWRTFAEVEVWADGHGEALIRQNGVILARVTFGPEDQEPDVLATTYVIKKLVSRESRCTDHGLLTTHADGRCDVKGL